MRKFRKKPVVVDGIELTKENVFEVYCEVFKGEKLRLLKSSEVWDEFEADVVNNGLKLKTPESGEGTQIASIGDYILFGESKDLGRHCWPVKPDYFKDAYEEIE